MKQWYRKHFTWFLVGVYTNDGHSAILEMTMSGRRRYKYPYQATSKSLGTYSSFPRWVAPLQLWRMGGPFPNSFRPEKDILGALLSKMVSDGLIGKDNDR